MRPAVGGKSPVMQLNNVVLPAPFAPSIARRSPASMVEIDAVERDERTEDAAHALEREGVGARRPARALRASAIDLASGS